MLGECLIHPAGILTRMEKPITTRSAEKELPKKHRERSAFVWNTISGLLLAFQSVIMLVVITRVCDVVTAGVFTIAYANGNLFVRIGKYGMRQYQVSDRNDQFSFYEYRFSRILSSVVMMVCAVAYLMYAAMANGYSFDKTLVVLITCVFKLVDSVEDVYLGHYQQHDRLDVGAKALTARLATTLVVFSTMLVLTGALFSALVMATVYTTAFVAGEVRFVRNRFSLPDMRGGRDKSRALKLLKTCFPLFASSFLLFYIGNAPKYAIDALMDDAVQAYYGYIAMPVFVVSLLASFVYNPLITSLSDEWRAGNTSAFVLRFIRLVVVTAGITLACMAAAWLAGVPVLDLLYNAQTAPYLTDLVVLVAGGGFLALTSLAVLGITIIRFQRVLVPVYAVASAVAFFGSNWAVAGYGITGASWAYFFSMAALAVLFALAFIIGVLLLRKNDSRDC